MIIVLTVVSTITFFVSRLLPGDPISLWVGDHPTKEQLETAKKDLGFDRPVYEQYKSFLVGLLKLDLGFSLRTRQPVLEELSHRFFATFELVFVSMFVAVLFGFLLGLFSATQQGSSFDRLVRGVGYLGLSFPLFWLGMILQLIFFGLLKWLPLQGRSSGFAEADIDSIEFDLQPLQSANMDIFEVEVVAVLRNNDLETRRLRAVYTLGANGEIDTLSTGLQVIEASQEISDNLVDDPQTPEEHIQNNTEKAATNTEMILIMVGVIVGIIGLILLLRAVIGGMAAGGAGAAKAVAGLDPNGETSSLLKQSGRSTRFSNLRY